MADLFLPFTPKAKSFEVKAIGIKQAYGYGPYDLIDPHTLAERMGVILVPEAWFDTLPDRHREELLVDIGRSWSAASLAVEGTTHVLLNPGHTKERHSPSLAEELVHMALGHPKSQLLKVDGIPIRTCAHDVESEAYAVATALLMPYRSTFNHLKAGGSIDGIPAAMPVSIQCREYRTKMAGLWAMARKRAASVARGGA